MMEKAGQSPELPADLLAKKPDELTVGMYVHLNCSWFKHPFPKNTFKISSQDQLTTIRSLGLSSVLVDPRQSNPEVFASAPVEPTVSVDVPEETVDPALPLAAEYCETVHLASQMYKQVMKRGGHILKTINAESEEGVTAAKAMVDALSALILDSVESNTVASLLAAAEVDNTNVLHAVNVSTLSMIVGRHLQLSHEEIRFVGMAGLLHDLGEQRIPVRILRNRTHLSQEELQELQLHPDYTVELLRRLCQFPPEILEIIRCQHERLDGSGYPARLRGSQLSLPAGVLLVVDEYDSLVHKRRESESLMPSEALGQIYAKAKHQFPEDVVVALIKTVGVYPPGSIVELSDGTMGLVLSLNGEARMRPMVLLYDAAAAAGRPRVINLATESDRSIVRGLSKQQLSPAVRNYLDLHRWTGYFIESSFKTLDEPAKPS
jgi:HD-GYP domain-containing protein (c-di-GMP phosphodiesterase class II)